jgi:hypothetical protein
MEPDLSGATDVSIKRFVLSFERMINKIVCMFQGIADRWYSEEVAPPEYHTENPDS